MLRLFLLFNIAAIAVLAKDMEKCHQLLSSDAFGCCKVKIANGVMDRQDDGCVMKPPPDCEGQICFTKKLGLTTADDGTFDKKAMEEHIRKMLEKSPETADCAVNTCVKGDLSIYGPAEYCDLIKLKHCLVINYLSHCPDWEETDVCSEVKMFVDQCS